MIGTPQGTKTVLSKYNINAKKHFGQNFLIDPNIIQKIIAVSNITKEDAVIEIGPGIGALTEQLSIVAKKVLCFEIDQRMVEILTNELKSDNVMVIEKDYLKAILSEYSSYLEGCKSIKVVSNLPYYITTPILFKLLEEKIAIDEIVCMIQKEVAQRIVGKPKTKDYNALSVMMQYKAKPVKCFDVPRGAFLPSPNVDSSVIKIIQEKKSLGIDTEEDFVAFIQAIFVQRRKTFVNNVTQAYGLSKEYVQQVLDQLRYSPTLRSEELSLEEIATIYHRIRGREYGS